MKLNKQARIIIGVLSAIIIAGGIYIATQSKPNRSQPAEYVVQPKEETINFSVKSFAPQGKVPQQQNFTITFSESIADESLINKELDTPAIQFEPKIRGRFRWIAHDTLRFFPEVALAPSTQYTATVSPQISPAPKYKFIGNQGFAFFTERFQVESAKLWFEYGTEQKSHAKIHGTVEFNYPVSIEALKKSLSLSYEGGSTLPYKVRTPGAQAKIVEVETEPVARGKYDQRLKLKLEAGFKCVNGQLGLDTTYTTPLILKWHEDLNVTNVFPEQKWNDTVVQIRFSSMVEPEAAKPYLTVEPEVDYQLTAEYHYLRLRGDFKPNQTYTVRIKQGLPSQDGALLKQDVSRSVTIKRLDPILRFVGEGRFLPRDGNLNIGLETINVDHVQLEFERIIPDNLAHLLTDQNWDEDRQESEEYEEYRNRTQDWLGDKWTGELLVIRNVLQTNAQENEGVTTTIALKNYLPDDRLGVFRVTARDANHRWRYAAIRVMITDLGIMVKRSGDELWVWVNSLSSLKPVADAKVELIAQTSHSLLDGETDADGLVRFKTDELPFIIAASKGNDMSFAQLNRSHISTTDFNVAGAPYPGTGYDAYLYTDRGVYRPGETANLATIVRGENNVTPPSFPVLLQVLDPNQQVFREFRAQTDAAGAAEFSIPFPDYAKTGGYTAKLLVADNEVGRRRFNVEAFMPDRIKVKIETDKPGYDLGEQVTVNVEAINLFGPPAANRKVVATCDIEAEVFSPEKWRSFRFAHEGKKFQRQRVELGGSQTDENGRATYSLGIPTGLTPSSSLRGILTATVSEPGGRAVSAYKRITIHPHAHYVGIRRVGEEAVEPNKTVQIEYIAVDKAGGVVPGRRLEMSVYKIHWNSVLRRDNRGQYRYISEEQAVKQQTEQVTSADMPKTFDFTPSDYGRYRIEVLDVELQASASTTFDVAGWGYAPWAMTHPDRLEIDLDKTTYQPGDVAKAQIKAPFSGKMLLTIEKDRVLEYRVVTLKENSAVIDIPIKAEYKPNAYISASLIRSTKSLETHAPARAFGVVPLKIAEGKLAVKFNTPGTIRPNREFEIPFQVTGGNGKTHVTIAAVDEGILQLTNFSTPDPHRHYFRQRRLSVDTYDLYSAILPEVEDRAKGKSSVGGDSMDGELIGADRMKRLSTVSVTRVKPVSLWSGIVKTDDAGNGVVRFNIPQFNGRLRLMAVAFAGERFGSSERYVTVREPIVVTPTFPRFVSGGDRFTVPVSVFNGTGKPGDFEVELTKEGFVEITGEGKQTVSIEAGSETQVFFDIATYDGVGKVTFNLSALGNDESAAITTNLPLRPAAPSVTKTGSGVVTAGEPSDFIFPSTFINGTEQFTLSISSFPGIEFGGGISYLLRYPHG
jgi:alpha-2-macroglobulin